MGFRIAWDQLDLRLAHFLSIFWINILCTTFLKLNQEVSKLLVVFQFIIFHGHNLIDMSSKVLQVVHNNLLIFDERMNILVIFWNSSLIYIEIRNLDFTLKEVEKHICVGTVETLESIFNLSCWSKKYLNFWSRNKVWICAKLFQEFIQEELSFLHKSLFFVPSSLLWWKWWDKDSWISDEK